MILLSFIVYEELRHCKLSLKQETGRFYKICSTFLPVFFLEYFPILAINVFFNNFVQNRVFEEPKLATKVISPPLSQ